MVKCSWINFFHFALFLGFLILSGFALKDALSGETTISVSKVKQDYVANFPSFSVCTNRGLNESQLQNGVMNEIPFEVKLRANFKVHGKWQGWYGIDVMNESEFSDYVSGTWYLNCKPYMPYFYPGCVPCLTYNIVSLKTAHVEKAELTFTVKPDRDLEEEESAQSAFVTFHNSRQSLMLKDSFDWSRSFFYTFRPGISLQIAHSLHLTENSLISNCTVKDDYDVDEELMALISEHINCSLPWSPFKVKDLQECNDENEFRNYLKALDHLQKQLKNIETKCVYKSWKTFPITENPRQGNTSLYYAVLMSNEDAVNIEKEIVVYTFPYFIGTFGGYLGLFLGGSILGYLQMVVQFFTSRTSFEKRT